MNRIKHHIMFTEDTFQVNYKAFIKKIGCERKAVTVSKITIRLTNLH